MKKNMFISGAVALGFIVSSISAPVSAHTLNDSESQESSLFTTVHESSTMNVQEFNGSSVVKTQSKKAKVKKKTKTSLNVRKGASTKYKVIKKLKKNTTVTLTGSKKGKWVKIQSGKTKGWVSSSYLKSIPKAKKGSGIGGSNSSKARKPTSKESRDWRAGLPSACKATPIKTIKFTNKKSSRWSMRFVTTTNGSKAWFTLNITGNIKPNHPASRALMKHECGHVLVSIYTKKKGGNSYTKLMNKGWSSKDKMRGEKVADCIADQLGAKRHKSGKGSYKVGYGTKCSSKQKSVAKTITNYSKNKRY